MKDCPRCHGSGEIGWNDSPINDPQCAQEATCNVCHGEGVVMLEDALLEALRSEFAGWVEHHPNGGHFDWIVATTNVYSAIEGALHYREALERIAHHEREGDVAGQVNAMRAIARDTLEAEK